MRPDQLKLTFNPSGISVENRSWFDIYNLQIPKKEEIYIFKGVTRHIQGHVPVYASLGVSPSIIWGETIVTPSDSVQPLPLQV